MIQLKAFSHDLRKNNGRSRIRTTWKTRSALAYSQFKMTVLPVVTGFLHRLRTQTIVRQKVYCTTLWPYLMTSCWCTSMVVTCNFFFSFISRQYRSNKTKRVEKLRGEVFELRFCKDGTWILLAITESFDPQENEHFITESNVFETLAWWIGTSKPLLHKKTTTLLHTRGFWDNNKKYTKFSPSKTSSTADHEVSTSFDHWLAGWQRALNPWLRARAQSGDQ